MHFFNTILDICFPIKCISCKKSGFELCPACLEEVPAAERESAKWVFPLYDYRHPAIKKSLHLLKYKGKKRLANIFSEIVYEKITEELSELSVMENFVNPILIPIPLSPKRYRERGFNQTELLCEEIIKVAYLRHGVNMKLEKNILTKPKETEHQALIKDRAIRLKNVVGSFSVRNEEKIKNRNIILIDDITTTGATLGEAKKVLKQAGARKIIAFTVAH